MEQFLKINDSLLRNKELELSEKLVISIVLSWQESSGQCFQSNQSIGDRIGLCKRQIRRITTNLNRYPWFKSQRETHINKYGKHSNSKSIVIDEKMLNDWLSSNIEIEDKSIKMVPNEQPIIEDEKDLNLNKLFDIDDDNDLINEIEVNKTIKRNYVEEALNNIKTIQEIKQTNQI